MRAEAEDLSPKRRSSPRRPLSALAIVAVAAATIVATAVPWLASGDRSAHAAALDTELVGTITFSGELRSEFSNGVYEERFNDAVFTGVRSIGGQTQFNGDVTYWLTADNVSLHFIYRSGGPRTCQGETTPTIRQHKYAETNISGSGYSWGSWPLADNIFATATVTPTGEVFYHPFYILPDELAPGTATLCDSTSNYDQSIHALSYRFGGTSPAPNQSIGSFAGDSLTAVGNYSLANMPYTLSTSPSHVDQRLTRYQLTITADLVRQVSPDALDSDEDGVPDSVDECELTPAGYPVNAVGCPDLDGDGVQDSDDDCLSTAGDSVGSDGCVGVLVALGDSYQSGEGTYSYVAGTDSGENTCHRSKLSYPYLVADALGWETRSFACSGAISKNIVDEEFKTEPPQIQGLQDALADEDVRVRAITVGIGGNDAKFSDILKECLTGVGLFGNGSCVDRFESETADPNVDELLRDAIQQVRSAYSAIARERDGCASVVGPCLPNLDIPVVVVGYPVFVGIPKNLGDDCENGFGAREVIWMRSKIIEFNQMLAETAAQYGFRFVDLYEAYDGHALCEGASQEWINDFDLALPTAPCTQAGIIACESIHPKVEGHAATAPVVQACIESAAQCPAPRKEQPPDPIALADDPWIMPLSETIGLKGRVRAGVAPGAPGSGPFDAWLNSSPVFLGSFPAAADGSATIDAAVPDGVEPGVHHLVVCRNGTSMSGPLRFCASQEVLIVTGQVEPVTPARILESRPGLVTVDGELNGVGRRAAGSVTKVQVAGRAGVPVGAGAALLNVTAIRPDGTGYLTVYGCGDRPEASNVNYRAGDVAPNAVFSPLNAAGEVCIFTLAGTELIVDVNGYVPTGGSPEPVTPARIVESRAGLETVDGGFESIGRRGAGSVTKVQVAGRTGVPVGAEVALLNVTAIRPDGTGYLTVYGCGDRPEASNVNYRAGDVAPNAVVAPLNAAGEVCIYTLAATDLIVDVNGYVPAGDGPDPVTPARLVESRPGLPTVDGRDDELGRRAAGSVTTVKVAGRAGVPDDIAAVFLNVTAIRPDGTGYLTVYGCGDRPEASNVNYRAGDVAPNSVFTPVNGNGEVCIYTYADTDLIVDINAYVRAS